MKRAIVTAAVVGVLMAGGMGIGHKNQAQQGPEQYVDGVVSDIRTQAAEEFKRLFANEVTAFFQNDDLSRTLGIESDGQARLEESIKSYINQYSMDEEKLSEAKASLDELLQNAEGLSIEEIQDRIKGIFEE